MENFKILLLRIVVPIFLLGCSNIAEPLSVAEGEVIEELVISKSATDLGLRTTSERINIGETVDIFSLIENTSNGVSNVVVTWSLIGDSGNLNVLSGGKQAKFTATSGGSSRVIAARGKSSIEVSIEVNVNVNAPPVALADIQDVVANGAAVTIDLLANDTDPESVALTVVEVGTVANTNIVNNNDGTVTYTPDANFFGREVIPYSITDGVNDPVSSTFTVNVVSPTSWTGRASDDSWSSTENWCGTITAGACVGGTAPTDIQVAIFSSSCDSCNVQMDGLIDLDGIAIKEGYTGTIHQNANNIEIGASDWIQSGGEFSGGSGAITIHGDLVLEGGRFISTSGLLLNSRAGSKIDFKSPAEFVHNSGQFSINPTTTAGCSSLYMDINADQALNLNTLSVRIRDTNGCNGSEQGILRNNGVGPVVVEGDLDIVSGNLQNGEYHLKSNAFFRYSSWNTKSAGGTSLFKFNGGKDQEYTFATSAKTGSFEIDNDGFNVSPGAGNDTIAIDSLKVSAGNFVTGAAGVTLRGAPKSNAYIDHTGGTLDLSNSAIIVSLSTTCSPKYFNFDSTSELEISSLDVKLYDSDCNGYTGARLSVGANGLKVKNNVILRNGQFQSGKIKIGGDLIAECVSTSNCFRGGSGSIEMMGAGDQSISITGSGSLPKGEFKIDKSAGNIVLATNISMAGTSSGQSFLLENGSIDLNGFDLDDIDGYFEGVGTSIIKGGNSFVYANCLSGSCQASD